MFVVICVILDTEVFTPVFNALEARLLFVLVSLYGGHNMFSHIGNC
jgi:hypothetical protein